MAMPLLTRRRKWSFRFGYKDMLAPLLVIAILLLVLLLVVAIYRASNRKGHGHHRLPPVESAQVLDHQKQKEAKTSKLKRIKELWRRLIYKIKAAGAVLTGSEAPLPPQKNKGPKAKGKTHIHVLNKKSGNISTSTTRNSTMGSVAKTTRVPRSRPTRKNLKTKRKFSTREQSGTTLRHYTKRKKRPTKTSSTTTKTMASMMGTVDSKISKATGFNSTHGLAMTSSTSTSTYGTSAVPRGGGTAAGTMPSPSNVSATVPTSVATRLSSQAETTKAHVTRGTSSFNHSAITKITSERSSAKANATRQQSKEAASTLPTSKSSSTSTAKGNTTKLDVTRAPSPTSNDPTALSTSRARLWFQTNATEAHTTPAPRAPPRAIASVGISTTVSAVAKPAITRSRVSPTISHASSAQTSNVPSNVSTVASTTTGVTSPSPSLYSSNTHLAGNLSSVNKTVKTKHVSKSSTTSSMPSAMSTRYSGTYSSSDRRESSSSRPVQYSSISSNGTDGRTAAKESNVWSNTGSTFHRADILTKLKSGSTNDLNETSPFRSSTTLTVRSDTVSSYSALESDTSPVSSDSTVGNGTNLVPRYSTAKNTAPVSSDSTVRNGTTPVLSHSTAGNDTAPVSRDSTVRNGATPVLSYSTAGNDTTPVSSDSTVRNGATPVVSHSTAGNDTATVSSDSTVRNGTTPVLSYSTAGNDTAPVSNHSTTSPRPETSHNTTEGSLSTLQPESLTTQNYTVLPISPRRASTLMVSTEPHSKSSPKSSASSVDSSTSSSTTPWSDTSEVQLTSRSTSEVPAATNASKATENCCTSSTERTTQLLPGIFGDIPFQVDGYRLVGGRSPGGETHFKDRVSFKNGSVNSGGTEGTEDGTEGTDPGNLRNFHLRDELDRLAEMYGKYFATRYGGTSAGKSVPVKGLPDFSSVWQAMSLGEWPSNLQTESLSSAVAFIPGLEVTTSTAVPDRQARFERLREFLLSENAKVPDLRKLAILEELEEKNEARSS